MSRQLEHEQQLLARLQEDEEEKSRQQHDRDLQRERERVRREEQDRAERERKEAEREHREAEARVRRAREEAERFQSSAEEQERLRQKELLLSKMKAIDEGRISTETGISGSHQNGVALRGKQRPPASEVEEVEGAVFGEYRPSFLAGSSASASRPSKKVAEKKNHREPPKDEILFFDQKEEKNGNGKSSPDLSFLGGGEGGSQTNKVGSDGDQLLPRRPRQHTASVVVNNNKTDVNIISDLGDDIEEVIL